MNEKILLEDVMIQTCTEKNKIESPWITGFFDGEGSFVVCVVKDNKRGIGWRTTLNIKIGLHEKDRAILELIKKLLGVGRIYKKGHQGVELNVQSLKEIEKLIEFFSKYRLITKKNADFLLFEKIFVLMKNKEHLTVKGLNKIVGLKEKMNLGISPDLKKAFPDRSFWLCSYKISASLDIETKIVPFFQKYPIQGVKSLDFQDFCKVVELIKEKRHLTKEGLEQISKIKTGMN